MQSRIFNFFGKFLLPILPFILVFIAAIYQPNDLDLGWHLKYGEYFFQHGTILKDNIFSTDMTDYKWPNTDWATDLITYAIFSKFGFLGLSFTGALVITLTFLFFSLAFKLSFWQKALIFPILLVLEKTFNLVSFRGQLLSVMFLGVMVYLITLFESGKRKALFLLPALFLIWGNINGQFALGLGVLGIWAFSHLLKVFVEKERRFSSIIGDIKFLSLVVVATLIATLINPFGTEIYRIIIVHFGDPQLKFIAEYLPFLENSPEWWSHIVVGILIGFGGLFLYFSDKIKDYISHLPGVVVLYGISFFVKRYVWSLYYLTIPFLKPVADFIKPDSEKMTKIVASFIILIALGLIVLIKDPAWVFA
ncbi:hypothetical protein HYS97_02770, partial [Candidatus Daviesbacteria bacterium]|nr:hypothetical protein [Candidatus Daviesbacteria bacterium]